MKRKIHIFAIDTITATAFAAFTLSSFKIMFEGWDWGRAITFAISGLWMMLYTCAHLDFKALRGDEE